MTVCELTPGKRGIIQSVMGRDALSLRLMEMGFTPGTPVELVCTGPGGDPLLLRLRGYTITITRRDAVNITVTREEAT